MSWLASMDRAGSYQEADSTRKLAIEEHSIKRLLLEVLADIQKIGRTLTKIGNPSHCLTKQQRLSEQQGA